MKLYAHATLDGEIRALIAVPDGDRVAMLIPQPGVQVVEIKDHGFTGDTPPLDELEELLTTHVVKVTPAHGELTRRRKTQRDKREPGPPSKASSA